MKNFFLFLGLLLSFQLQAATLKLLTWNLFMIPKPINFSLQQTRAPLIAEALLKRDNDVLVFQETFSGSARKKIIKQLKEIYPHQTRLKGTFLHLNSGLLVLSKYPFRVLDSLHFKNCTNSDCFAAKGIILVEVTLPEGEKIQIATTHLQAWNNDKSRNVRLKQLAEIKEVLDQNAASGIPQVLAGDLNIDGQLPEIEYNKALSVLEMESSPLSGNLKITNGFNVSCYKTPGGEANGEWLDHVFLKKHETPASVLSKTVVPLTGMIKNETCPLSDHYAVEAVIHF